MRLKRLAVIGAVLSAAASIFIWGCDSNPADGETGSLEFVPRRYTVQLNYNSGVWVISNPIVVDEGSSLGSRLPANPVRSGYRFDGWFAGNTQYTSTTRIYFDVTLTARWTAGGVMFAGHEMVFIQGGQFLMGCRGGTTCTPNNGNVTINRNYYIGRYPVTQSQWTSIMGSNPSFIVGSNLPVTGVSWNDVQSFINTLNSRNPGRNFRLPTEAEWEYAARGGQNFIYAGSNDVNSVAWYSGNSGNRLQPVGTKAANGYNIHDMSGNVWEWVSDWFGGYTTGAKTNPTGPTTGTERVLRGGSYPHIASNSEIIARAIEPPNARYSNVGFRLAMPVP